MLSKLREFYPKDVILFTIYSNSFMGDVYIKKSIQI